MARTLEQLLLDANAFLDLSAELPTGGELDVRQNYADRAVWDASAYGQFSEFDCFYDTYSSLASVSLPTNFREFKTNPREYVDGTWVEYEEILPQERYNKSTGDKYCYVLGNPAAGYTVVFNNLSNAVATLSMLYQRFPSGLLTLSDVCELTDPTFVSTQVESYVLQGRGDDRFPYVDATAQRKLKNMVGREMKSPGGGYRMTPAHYSNPLA